MQEIIVKKMEELTSTGKVDEIVTKEVTTAIQNTIKRVLDPYSDVGKAMQEKLTNDILSGMEKMDFVQYASSLNSLVQAELGKGIIQYGLEPALEMIKEFGGQLEKKEWKLSEIIAQFIEQEVLPEEPHESGEISLVIEKSKYGSIWIGFDPESGHDTDYRCKYRISVNEKDGVMWFFSNEQQKLTPLIKSNLSGFDLFLFKLYACKCTIVVDESDCETEWSTYN